MNREQMIAWLTLEGWYPSCPPAFYRIYCDSRKALIAYVSDARPELRCHIDWGGKRHIAETDWPSDEHLVRLFEAAVGVP